MHTYVCACVCTRGIFGAVCAFRREHISAIAPIHFIHVRTYSHIHIHIQCVCLCVYVCGIYGAACAFRCQQISAIAPTQQCAFVCVCVRVRERESLLSLNSQTNVWHLLEVFLQQQYIYIYINIHVYIYTYVYICNIYTYT